MLEKPIAIFGFGRSGTTWLSDIISKCLGGMILFEPFHPNVWNDSNQYTYEPLRSDGFDQSLNSQLSKCYKGEETNPWLLRNHIGVNPLEFSQAFIEMVWANSEIIGFKTIRLNHVMVNFKESHQCIYILRHPLSVISSILKRPNFFEEFGWDFHLDVFFKRTLEHPYLKGKFDQFDFTNMTHAEKVGSMWALSSIIGLIDCQKYGIKRVYYEDLYDDPYQETEKILESFDLIDIPIHPSYIFTPSMLTLKTAHNFDKGSDVFLNEGPKAFWKDTFSDSEADKLMDMIGQYFSEFDQLSLEVARYFNPNP